MPTWSYNVLVVLCNKSYTSKTCPKWGHVHEKLGRNKKFQYFQCSYTTHQDWNSDRNTTVVSFAGLGE